MSDLDDVRRIALALPEAVETPSDPLQAAFSVLVRGKAKGFAWTWLERVQPKRPRVPQPLVLAVRVADADDKEALLASDERKLFTEPHYDGFPAVLVRLPEVSLAELEELVVDAWRAQAPRDLVERYDASRLEP